MFNKSLYLINLYNNMNLFPNSAVRESKERDLRKDRNIRRADVYLTIQLTS